MVIVVAMWVSGFQRLPHHIVINWLNSRNKCPKRSLNSNHIYYIDFPSSVHVCVCACMCLWFVCVCVCACDKFSNFRLSHFIRSKMSRCGQMLRIMTIWFLKFATLCQFRIIVIMVVMWVISILGARTQLCYISWFRCGLRRVVSEFWLVTAIQPSICRMLF